MWILLRSIMRDEPEFAINIRELFEATQRNFIYTMMAISLACLFWVTADNPGDMILKTSPLIILISLASAVTVWMLGRGYLLGSQIVWQLSWLGLITLAVVSLGIPNLVMGFIFLPLIAMAAVGWWLALGVEICLCGIVFWLAQNPALPAMDGSILVLTVLGGFAGGLLGWAAINALLTLAQWGLDSFHTSRALIGEARLQRQELLQVQDDMLRSNRELARLSNRLKVMTRVAEEARRVKEEFVANVSHELRTPLNMVIGFCEVITDSPRVYGQLPASLLADIAAIQRNGQHLISLVNDVLDLSQIEAGRMELIREWTSAQEIVDAAIIAVRPLFESKGLFLEKVMESEPIQLFCDGTRIREVLLNLLSNAGRFTEQGGVRIRARQQGDTLTIAVEDSGPGISAENLKKLFEPFQQLDNSIRRREGTGLGLSISKRFVEMHGGKMWVESELGQGTTFLFSLPLELPLVAPGDTARVQRWINPYFSFEREVRRSRAPLQALVSRYVLLETGHTLQRLFERYLGSVDIAHTHSSDEALEELNKSPSQALVVNKLSAEGDSYLFEQIKGLPFGAPVIECWVPGDDEPSRRLGVRRYLTKPVKREELLQAITQVGTDVRTILIVDDQPEVLQLFGRMLASAEQNYTVIRAKNGQHALDLLRQRRPDLILLDLVMPELDGFEVLRAKNQDENIREIPVIIVSSNDPAGTPIVSDHVNVRRSEGFSAREFLACVQAISEVFSPKAGPEDPVPKADYSV